ncbi:MAG: anti-sigma factor [Acidimicrobiales bacterium]
MNGNGNATVNGEVHTLLGAYVLDSVDDLERVAFERHLAGCEPCRDEVIELQATAARLAESTAATPPPELRGRVLEAARETRQLPPGELPKAERRETPATRTWRRRALIAVAAAVVAIAAAGTTVTLMGRQLDEERETAANVAAVLAAPDADVNSEAITGGGRASVVSSAGRGEAVVVLDGLPELENDQTYQLWYIDDPDTPVIRSAGTIGAEVDTSPRLLTEVEDALLVALSVEPSGGSEQPTTTPLTFVPLT